MIISNKACQCRSTW